MIKCILDSDKSLYDFQIKTNERLYKLQLQVNTQKERLKSGLAKMTHDTDRKIKDIIEPIRKHADDMEDRL